MRLDINKTDMWTFCIKNLPNTSGKHKVNRKRFQNLIAIHTNTSGFRASLYPEMALSLRTSCLCTLSFDPDSSFPFNKENL